MVASGRLQHVGNKLCGDRRAGLVLLVLTSVWEVGDDGGDAAGGGGFAGVNHDEEFHEAVVDLARGGRLEDKDCIVLLAIAILLAILAHCRSEGANIPSSSRTDSPTVTEVSWLE